MVNLVQIGLGQCSAILKHVWLVRSRANGRIRVIHVPRVSTDGSGVHAMQRAKRVRNRASGHGQLQYAEGLTTDAYQ